MSEYGYVRVSSIDQNEERQMVEMRKLGIAEERTKLRKKCIVFTIHNKVK